MQANTGRPEEKTRPRPYKHKKVTAHLLKVSAVEAAGRGAGDGLDGAARAALDDRLDGLATAG